METMRLALRIVAVMIIVFVIVRFWMNAASKIKITEFFQKLWTKISRKS